MRNNPAPDLERSSMNKLQHLKEFFVKPHRQGDFVFFAEDVSVNRKITYKAMVCC